MNNVGNFTLYCLIKIRILEQIHHQCMSVIDTKYTKSKLNTTALHQKPTRTNLTTVYIPLHPNFQTVHQMCWNFMVCTLYPPDKQFKVAHSRMNPQLAFFAPVNAIVSCPVYWWTNTTISLSKYEIKQQTEYHSQSKRSNLSKLLHFTQAMLAYLSECSYATR